MAEKIKFSKLKKVINAKKQKEKFPEIAKKVIEMSDIVLEVIDARFSNISRNEELEEYAKQSDKKWLFVLNKSDLTDKSIKAKAPENLKPRVFVSAKKRKGILNLRNKIKIEAKKINKGKRIYVGVIGYPNAGKSTLINALSGKSGAKTSRQAGFTKGLQKIRLSENLILIDTPGVIPKNRYSSSNIKLHKIDAIIGARSSDNIKNPEIIAEEIIKTYIEKFKRFYKINKDNPEEFLTDVGRIKNYLKKGGSIDTARAAKYVLKDWQEGKIK